MKILQPVAMAILLAACSVPSGTDVQSMPTASNAPTASGVVTAIDAPNGTITIDHGPVEALNWPAATMTFRAPSVDLHAIKREDRVRFQPTADGRITGVERE